MKIERIFTGADNQSHFETVDLQEVSDNAGGMFTALQSATGIMFNSWQVGRVADWHPAPRRQYLVVLSGRVEFEVGDGTKRQFGLGEVILAEDITGQGHITRVIGKEPRSLMLVPLD